MIGMVNPLASVAPHAEQVPAICRPPALIHPDVEPAWLDTAVTVRIACWVSVVTSLVPPVRSMARDVPMDTSRCPAKRVQVHDDVASSSENDQGSVGQTGAPQCAFLRWRRRFDSPWM